MEQKATIRLIRDTKSTDDKRFLRIRVTFDRKTHYYAVDSKIKLTEKEFKNSKLKITKDAFAEAKPSLEKAEDIINELGNNFTFPKFAKLYKLERYGARVDRNSFLAVAYEYLETKNLSLKSISLYKTAINKMEAYCKGINLYQLDKETVKNFIHFLKQEKSDISENTIRIYLRHLRAIYQYAIDTKYINTDNPFKNIPQQPLSSIKRENVALEMKQFEDLFKYKPENDLEKFGKDFFFLSFHLCGANINDILRLRNKNILGKDMDSVEFIRHKTQRTHVKTIIALTSDARKLIEEYGRIVPEMPDEFILPYLKQCTDEKARNNKIHDIIKRINKGLKQIGTKIGIEGITTYTARHTFATYARDVLNFDLMQIAKCLGHSSTNTTENYLGTLTQNFRDYSKKQFENLMNSMLNE